MPRWLLTPQNGICLALMIAGMAVHLALYRRLPAILASHFDPSGRPNDWMGKFGFFWLILGVEAFLIAVMSWARLQAEAALSPGAYPFHLENYKVVLVGFFAFLQVFIVLLNARIVRFSLWIVNIPIAIVVIYGLFVAYLRFRASSGGS